MKAIRVFKNNEGVYTHEAYTELRLTMSTGDFHTHKTEEIEINPDTDEYIDFIEIEDADGVVTLEYMTFNDREAV